MDEEGLTWSDECPDCDQEMMLTRSGEFYRCEDCDKDYHETELFTF